MTGRIRRLFPEGSIKGDALRISAFQILSLGIGLLAGILVARTLGPAKKGVIDLFNLLTSFIVDFGLVGFGSGLLYYQANRGRPVGEVHGTGLVFSLAAGALVAAVGWAGLPAWQAVLPGMPPWIALAAFLLSPVRFYSLVWSNVMTGLNAAVGIQRVNAVFAAANTAIVLGLWATDRLTVEALVVAMILFALAGGGATFGILYSREPRLSFSAPLLRDGLSYGVVVYVGVVANALHFKVDQFMINWYLGTEAVGIYAVSVRWAETLFLLDSALAAAALYRISSSPPDESIPLTWKLFRAQLLISGASGVVLALLAGPLVRLLYGDAFRGAVLPLVLLVPGVVAWSATKVVSNMLTYNRAMKMFVTGAAVFGAAMNVGLNYLFLAVMRQGIAGAAMASSISYSFVVGLILFRARGVGADAPH